MDIFATPPELEVDAASYEYIMPLVTKAYINNAASTDDDDIVMAYVDGELRGYSNLDLSVAGQNLAFVSVFYDTEDIGKEIEFNIWHCQIVVLDAEPGGKVVPFGTIDLDLSS